MSGTIQARPTLYKGIQMRSRLEARFAAELDHNRDQWRYEPICFADESGQYLPDFRVDCSNGEVWFIEVKPTQSEALRALLRMKVIWASEPQSHLFVVWPGMGGSFVYKELCL